MKLYYFNDTSDFQIIHINDLYGQGKTLEPQSGQFFELPLTNDQCPFIKMWNGGVVLISSMYTK